MGSNFSNELADTDLFPDLDLSSAIAMHLRGNHYPPVPLTMVQPCIDSIIAYNDGYAYNEIKLPEGVSYKGKSTAPAWAMIEQHHLSAWIDEDE
jgi:hypothetical protein